MDPIFRYKVLLFLALGFQACGDLNQSTSEDLIFEVESVFEVPEFSTAKGNAFPTLVTLSLVNVILHGDSDIDLSPTDPIMFNSIDRPQIIYTQNLKEYREQLISGASIVLDSDFSIQGRYKKFRSRITEPTITATKAFTLVKNKGLSLKLKLKIQNIMTRDDARKKESTVSPGFSLTLEQN